MKHWGYARLHYFFDVPPPCIYRSETFLSTMMRLAETNDINDTTAVFIQAPSVFFGGRIASDARRC